MKATTSKRTIPVGPSKDSNISLSDYMKPYKIQKGESVPITNTRIGSTEHQVYGGKFNFTNYPEFIQVYYQEVFVKGNPEYLTETQLETGPILVDVDFRHDFSVTTRQYTQDNIAELIDSYLAIFKEVFQLDDGIKIQAFIFQKPTVNRVVSDNITKDGIHIIFTLACDHIVQQVIRKKVIDNISDIWSGIPITNSWEAVFDEGISKGGTPWQLIGSRKPGCEPYRLIGFFTAIYDSSDKEFSTTFSDSSIFDMKKDIFKLSARYPDHETPFLSTGILAEYNSLKDSKKPTVARTPSPDLKNNVIEIDFNPLTIRTREQLDTYLRAYLDSLPPERYFEYEAYSYTMILPAHFYEKGSYDRWFKVGCALRNISPTLFIVWLAFSAQSSTFSFLDVSNLWEQWNKFEKMRNGLKLRSIIFWAKAEVPDKYKEVRENSIDYYIEQSLDSGLGSNLGLDDKKVQGSTDWDIGKVLYQLKKDSFVCASVRENGWYEYRGHRWVEIDCGTSLRTVISTELRNLYGNKAKSLWAAISQFEDPDDPKAKALSTRAQKAIEIHSKLGRTPDKRNLMDAAKDIFYDSQFNEKIDTNPHLLCCSNGVWDFKEGIFRDGRPDDYISMSTNIEYFTLSEKHNKTIDEITDFMKKLFPIPELLDYMWSHLASTLVGTAENQTFNNYIGGGRNGKSVLVTLMTKVLGEYKGELPLTAVVTNKRVGVGGLAPEIVKLKGKRFAVMQEPRQGDVINEGILKELTSGLDAIQARGLYGSPVTFIPQFKLVVCANVLPEIKAQDHGTWRRIRVVPFLSLFTEEPVEGDEYKPYQFKIDPTINEKFDEWKSVFLSMLVNKILATKGVVVDCNTVLEASKEYKKKQDILSQFIDEKIEKTNGQWLKQTDVNQAFKIWHEENFGTKGPQAKELHSKLDQVFGVHIKQMGWRDVRLVYDQPTQSSTIVDDFDADF